MAYTIKYSNGKILATVADQSFDSVSTSITLVGKNSNAYGEYINNNLVHMLENFANSAEPTSPMTGQLWYNTVAGRLYVYTTSSFKPVGGPIISPSQPASLVPGDLWIDTTANKLWWYNGTTLVGTGKDYSDVTGKAGWVLETVKDVDLVDQNIASLYNNGILVGVLSDRTIPLNTIYCGTATIYPGITLNSELGYLRFRGTATHAESILDPASGKTLNPDDFFRIDFDNNTTASINVRLDGDAAISVGTDANLQFLVDTTAPDGLHPAAIYSAIEDAKFDFKVNSSFNGGPLTVLTLDGTTGAGRLGINNRTPAYTVDVDGDVRVNGNFIVNGSSTYITSYDLRVNDKNIDLAYPPGTLSDADVDGGGIVLHGTSNHSWIYSDNSSVKGWQTENNINLINANSTYKIAGIDVLSQNSLGLQVTSAPGLINLPIMPQVRFTGMTLAGNTVTTVTFPITDLVLDPSGTVNVNNHRITNVGTVSTSTDAANKKYVDDEIALNAGGFQGRKPYVLTLDVTDFLNVNQDIKGYLDKVLPVDGGGLGPLYRQPDGAACSVVAITYTATTASFILNLNKNFVQLNSSTSVVGDVAGNVTITTMIPKATQQVKHYLVSSSTWVFVGNVA